MATKTTTSATCPECQTDFSNLPVDFDEDGYGNAILEVRPCSDPTCGKLLCPCCATFQCDGCGETFCTDHLVAIPDGTDRPLQCCAACAAQDEALQAPELPAAACIECHQPVTLAHAQTSDIFGTWHTECWNLASDRAAAFRTEMDELAESRIPAPKPMGAAVAPATRVQEVA
jgi:hypothetical protein